MFDARAARREVLSKSEADIERETALKWASRALACYALFEETRAPKWLLRAEDYRHEALEHAATAGDGGRLVGQVQSRLDEVRPAGLE